MLYKLKACGVVGPILGILESFLQERSLNVVLDGQYLPLYITNAGVFCVFKCFYSRKTKRLAWHRNLATAMAY